MPKRINRIVKPADELESRLLEQPRKVVEDVARRRWMYAVAGLALLLVAVVGAFALEAVRSHRTEGATVLADGVKTLSAAIVKEGQKTPEGVTEHYPDEKARTEAALKQFEGAAAQEGVAATLAEYYAGAAAQQAERLEDAKRHYQAFVDRTAARPEWADLRKLGMHGLAQVFEDTDAFPQAEKLYADMLNMPGEYLVQLAMVGQARCQARQGRWQDGAATLQKLLDKYAESPMREEVEKRAAFYRAKAAAPAMPADAVGGAVATPVPGKSGDAAPTVPATP